ncbi:MAG TPA: preprotein translocase subunit SecG [Xanthobacteraceae bacterium]|nr:preprotein translocase subunit SecG [Xanthobacteraceae bacterium]
MESVIIVIHLIIVLALTGVILVQRSEGGGLGIGGGGGGGFMSSRGTSNLLTRTTAILAGIFFVTSLLLSWLAGHSRGPSSIINTSPAPISQPGTAVPPTEGGILDSLKRQEQSTPQAPQSQ